MADIEASSIDELERNAAKLEKSDSKLDMLDAESDIQTITALGGEHVIAGLQIRPPTIGVIMLLQAADSPFLRQNDGIQLREIIEALFIMQEGRKIANLLVTPKRRADFLAKAKDIAEKGPEYSAEYLKAIGSAQLADEYDRKLAEFAEAIGPMPITETALKIQAYINMCFTGFAAVANVDENDADSEKKKIRPELDDRPHILPFRRDSG